MNTCKLMITIAICLMTFPAFAENMCFTRHYDAAHLSKHPNQLVTSVTLALNNKGVQTTSNPSVTIAFAFQIAMTKRGDDKLYVQEGYVEKDGAGYKGVVECDGGGFGLRKAPSGLLLSLERIRVAVVPDPCGEGDQSITQSIDIEKGKDDGTFRLDVAPTQVCSRLFDKIDWNAVGNTNQ